MNARGATSTAPRSRSLAGVLGADHVVERVVQRAQVRVDLGHEVAGQEPEPLPGLDRRAGEDDAVDLLGLQRLHGHGHRQPALAGAGRADAEGDDVLADGVDVALLPARLRAHRAAARRAQHLGGEHLGRALVGLHHLDGAAHRGGVEAVALLDQHHEVLEQPRDPLDVVVAVEGDLVAAHVDRRRRGTASSMRRSTSSRSPRSSGIRWLLGTEILIWVLDTTGQG